MRYFDNILTEIATWCNHDPTPDSGIIINNYDVLFVTNETPAKVYVYHPSTKTSDLLTVTDITTVSLDISHTQNKLWLYNQTLPYTYKEWDITLIPFMSSFNRSISNIILNAGLGTKDDNTLIAIDTSAWPVVSLYESDITNPIAVNTFKFNLLPSRNISGDYMLTTTNKFIITTWQDAMGLDEYHITQYNYLTGVMEVDITISPTITMPFGIFEYDGNIYIVDNMGYLPTYEAKIYIIDKTAPYTLTLFDTTPYGIYGASQVPEQLTVHFT